MDEDQKLFDEKNSKQTSHTHNTVEDMIQIHIVGDGNCFFRCLSQAIDNSQENYHYYRILVYNYIYHNKGELKNFFSKKENENENDYNNRYLAFINSIKNNYNYAGDFEIASAAMLLHRKIIIYRHNFNGYEFLNEYNTSRESFPPINIIFKNNNHFNLLLNKDNENLFKLNQNEITNFEHIHKDIEKSIEKLDFEEA